MRSVMTLEFVLVHFWSVLLRRKEPGSHQNSPWVRSGMGDSTIPVSSPLSLEQEFGEPSETSHQQCVSRQEAAEEDAISLWFIPVCSFGTPSLMGCACFWLVSAAEQAG